MNSPIPLLLQGEAPQAAPWQVSTWLGAPLTLDRLRGRVVVLHTFQMLCPACVLHGLPQASRIAEHFDSSEVVVVGLHTVFEHHAVMGEPALRAFVHEFRFPFSIGIDQRAQGQALPMTMAAYRLRGTPSMVLIDAQGRSRCSVFGRCSDLAVGAAVGALVEEARSEARNEK